MGGVVSRKMLKRKTFKDVQTVHMLPRRDSLSRSLTWPTIRFFRSTPNRADQLSKEKIEGKLFSDYEVDLVRKSWKQVYTEPELFSINVYLRIFECDPGLKILFSWRDLDTDKLIHQDSFKRQAVAIISVIDQCVNALDNIQDSVQSLHQLGKFHTKLRGYGFKPEHWHLFKLSILLSLAFAIETDNNKQELLEAWNSLITFIVGTMKVGFDEGMKTYLENYNLRRSLE